MKHFFAQKAFITHKGALLCVQRSNDDPYIPNKWEVPGGRMEAGETIDAHIKREVFEEVGLTITPIRPFHLWQWVLEGAQPPVQIVAAAVLATPETFDISYENREQGETLGQARWIPFGDLQSIDWAPDFIPVIDSFLKLPEIAEFL